MPDLRLYNAPQSTCSQRVRFVLNAKGLAFEERRLDLFGGDQLKPDYLKLNPNGVVPTLVYDGEVVIDSSVIVELLDELHPEPEPLRPADPFALARMRALMRYIDEVPTPAVRVPSYNLAFLPAFQAMSEEEFLAVAESKPLRKEFLLKMGRTGFPKAEMDQALDRLRRGVARMHAAILESGGPWIMGGQLTLADVAMMPNVVRMDDIGLGHFWDDKPEVGRWLELIRAHPAYQPTYYFGSLLTEKYPHLRDSVREQTARSPLSAA
ncbi:MAG TPA: glutathione S-transferase N-terminal domain-containing protein [Afifellaceae bacterium]|nr:glutathione S-transferase N-terminal domain-containing protein [Afifellaceae bacterium]